MKKLLALLALFICTPAVAQHAQLSSNETQMGATTVTFNQTDAISSMHYDSATGLYVRKAGAYFIVAAPQVIAGKGCYNAWLTVNNTQIPNSNVQYCSQSPKATDVIISQGVSCFKSSDFINVQQSGTGIKAIFPDGEPQIPSIIFTAFRIGDC